MKKRRKPNQLVPVKNGQSAALYVRMQAAIAECFSIDDCKNIATQAAAIAAYYKQIKDDESVKKFLQIKIRAWRRIGEILASAKIDKAGCEGNYAEYIRRVRASFKGHKDIEALSDSAFRQAVKIAELPQDFFDSNVGRYNTIEKLLGAYTQLCIHEWEQTPEGKAELDAQAALLKHHRKQEKARRLEEWNREQAAENKRREEAHELAGLKAAKEEAFKEVGITLDRRDREQMHATVFLLKKSVHEILRKAAFDHRMTMQAIIRSGLMMWFAAHGYSIPIDDMNLPYGEMTEGPRRSRRP